MSESNEITYGNPIWETDSDAAYQEAERRIQWVLADTSRTQLFLSDLDALIKFPPALAKCTHLIDFSIGFSIESVGEIYGLDGPKSRCNNFEWKLLSHLTNLQQVNCSRTQINSLKLLKGLKALQTLDCSYAQVSDLTPLKGLKALKTLGCSYTQVSDLTPLKGLKALQTLDCSYTQVSDLTPLKDLNTLQTLDCFLAQISDLTPLKDLKALQTLNCSHTQISDLTPLENLMALKNLGCSSTQINDLGPLKDLKALQNLECSHTQVSDLTPLENLPALQNLDCSSTQISDLTPLKTLKDLHYLNISRCTLTRISLALLQNKNMRRLTAYLTNIVGIPSEALSQDSRESCLSRLRAHLSDLGEHPIRWGDVKLMVLGNGRIGKTQICNRLHGLKYQEDADSTHGITLATAPIPNSDFVFNIWDFGGQDIYHGTHALFLKSRAIFMLVWTPDAEENAEHTDANGMVFRNKKLNWWLDYVRQYGSDASPLVIVQNQIDKTPSLGQHEAVTEWRKKHPNTLCDIVAYSAKTESGHGALQGCLSDSVKQFNPPFIGQGRQKVIFKLRALRERDNKKSSSKRKNRTLSFAQFEQMCNDAGQISDAAAFLEFLHNAGEVFWRKGHFDDQVILDQAWVLEAIYTLFNREHCVKVLQAQGGRFTADLLNLLVWEKEGHTASDQELFLKFMQVSGVCFSLEASFGVRDEQTYIAPDYLPEHCDREQLLAFDAESKATRAYTSPPSILMRNVISRIGKKAGVQADYWRGGVAFYDTDTNSRVLIKQSLTQDGAEGNEILLETAGGDHTKMLATLLRMLTKEEGRLGISAISKEGKNQDTLDKERPLTEEKVEIAPGPDPKRKPSYYVSYAWDEKGITSEDEASISKIVDDLEDRAKKRGIHLHRDKNEINIGTSIDEYMRRLINGDQIIIILSERYLKSRACMRELYGVWSSVNEQVDRFRDKVRVYTHENTKIWKPIDRAKTAEYWKNEHEEETPYLGSMGKNDRVSNLELGKFVNHVGDILSFFSDTLQPRNLDELETYAFGEDVEPQ